MNKFFSHLRTVHAHRKWVRHYCFRAGLYWQGLTHDLSKYSPAELIESVEYYSGTRSPIDAAKEDKGYSNAWLHHRGRNKHHREYWTDYYDKGTGVYAMPYKYAVEMLCDYLGAGKAYNGDSFTFKDEYEWWKKQLDNNILIHPHTAYFITSVLRSCAANEQFNAALLPSYFGEATRFCTEQGFKNCFWGRSNGFKDMFWY